jgi:hypothetical protein
MARRRPNAELRNREYLTEPEVEKLLAAVKNNRWGHRDMRGLVGRGGMRPSGASSRYCLYFVFRRYEFEG